MESNVSSLARRSQASCVCNANDRDLESMRRAVRLHIDVTANVEACLDNHNFRRYQDDTKIRYGLDLGRSGSGLWAKLCQVGRAGREHKMELQLQL